jgi:hypothetical protein
MKHREVHALDQVSDDLLIAREFYDRIEIGLGDYFKESIFAKLSSLSFYAGIHQKHYDYYRVLGNPFPFAIYYDIIDAKVIAVAVLDMRQDPKSIAQQLEQRKDRS